MRCILAPQRWVQGRWREEATSRSPEQGRALNSDAMAVSKLFEWREALEARNSPFAALQLGNR
jgi:hypothetical protein